MASSDQTPGPMPPGDGSVPPGKPMGTGKSVLDKSASMMQSLKPVNQISQHACTFAAYSHDMSRQIVTHHYLSRVNDEFLQCAVYDSDEQNARLIGVEYIVSDKVFDTLSPEEQKLWHSHADEIKSGMWVNPRVPEMLSKLQDIAQSYGKFWCTWQTDRGDRLPLGAPALMMSPDKVKSELVTERDGKYNISTDGLKESREKIELAKPVDPHADVWKNKGKGFAIDIQSVEMKRTAPLP
ncbi:oil body-associated protein 2B-like [Impatiens glandulifera]|uniref:oil body-associated protein 2B-like n=1 Tax=Impatiens glandulifera TaxID=253017 RepID=UPI001FB05B26|nr:oil body-associated protein 2B-like [Impatiens glandulifera]